MQVESLHNGLYGTLEDLYSDLDIPVNREWYEKNVFNPYMSNLNRLKELMEPLPVDVTIVPIPSRMNLNSLSFVKGGKIIMFSAGSGNYKLDQDFKKRIEQNLPNSEVVIIKPTIFWPIRETLLRGGESVPPLASFSHTILGPDHTLPNIRHQTVHNRGAFNCATSLTPQK